MSAWFFLRGLVRESGHWAGFPEKLAGPQAVPLDLPGNGRRFRERSPLNVVAMAEAAREEFLRHRRQENYLFALSLGGMVALAWLQRWPQDFRGVVLVNTSVRGLSPFPQRLRAENYGTLLRIACTRDPAARERRILELTSGNLARREELTEAWAEIARQRPVARANAARQLLAAARFRPPVANPEVPILVLNGAGDRLVHPACSAALAKAWGLPLRVHPHAGHDLTLDEPEWVVKQVNDWLATLFGDELSR